MDDFSAGTKLNTVFDHRDPVTPVPPDIATCIYRVAQESLNNVARHAGATDVEVGLIFEDDLVSLSIRDNGVGFNLGHVAQSCPRLGLLSMKERVRLVHGMLEVVTAPGQGTHVQVQAPLQRAPDG